jgi:hypothetical protein
MTRCRTTPVSAGALLLVLLLAGRAAGRAVRFRSLFPASISPLDLPATTKVFP